MQKVVEEFLAKAEAEEKAKNAKYREKVLNEAGIFEKEYSWASYYTSEYPEFDSHNQKFYRKMHIEVTDDEWEAIHKVHGLKPIKMEREKSTIATALKVIGSMIYMFGFILGIVIGVDDYGDFYFTPAITVWAYAFISGTVMLGFAEIIKLLQDIKYKN